MHTSKTYVQNALSSIKSVPPAISMSMWNLFYFIKEDSKAFQDAPSLCISSHQSRGNKSK